MDTIAAFFITLGVVGAAHMEQGPRPEPAATAVEQQQTQTTAHRSEALQRWLQRRAELERRRIRLTNDYMRELRRARFATTAREADSRS